jgi:hypothetical protein
LRTIASPGWVVGDAKLAPKAANTHTVVMLKFYAEPPRRVLGELALTNSSQDAPTI